MTRQRFTRHERMEKQHETKTKTQNPSVKSDRGARIFRLCTIVMDQGFIASRDRYLGHVCPDCRIDPK
jgi:hypothetical protein